MDATLVWPMAAAMGLYQGLNPPTGWLFGVARGLERRSLRSLLAGTWALAYGHFLAMAALLAPFAIVWAVVDPNGTHLVQLQILLSYALVGFGIYKLVRPRHPRFIARIPPTRPVRWSFFMALTHCGSPLMMLPSLAIVLDAKALNGTGGYRVADCVASSLLLSAAMAIPLFATSCVAAIIVFRRFGLRAIGKYWFNFDVGWAGLTIGMGLMGFAMGRSPMAGM